MSEHSAEKDAAYREQAEALIADLRARVSHYEALLVAVRKQVWCVVYDSPNPSMDGGPHPIRMADQDYEIAVRNYEFMQRQQRVAPKKNLRIETRWVTEYARVTSPEVGQP